MTPTITPRQLLLLPLILGLLVLVGCQGNPTSTEETSDSAVSPPDIPAGSVDLRDRLGELNAATYYTLPMGSINQQLRQLGLESIYNETDLNTLLVKAFDTGLLTDLLPATDITVEKVTALNLKKPLTRSALAYYLMKSANATADTTDLPTFDDVPEEHPHFAAVEWAVKQKLFKGRMVQGEFRFSPDEPISRADFCAMAPLIKHQPEALATLATSRALQLLPPRMDLPEYRFEKLPDTQKLTTDQQKACGWFYSQGLFWQLYGLKPQAMAQSGFNPNQAVTQWELITLMAGPSPDERQLEAPPEEVTAENSSEPNPETHSSTSTPTTPATKLTQAKATATSPAQTAPQGSSKATAKVPANNPPAPKSTVSSGPNGPKTNSKPTPAKATLKLPQTR